MQSGSAADHWSYGPGFQVGKDSPPLPLELRYGHVVLRFHQIDQVMGNFSLHLNGCLGSADVHPTIDLHRVDRNDLSPTSLGETDCDLGLSRGGGAQNGNGSQDTTVPRR